MPRRPAACPVALRARPLLDWVESIDVEQALCELSKYDAYCRDGVSAAKRFCPAGASSSIKCDESS